MSRSTASGPTGGNPPPAEPETTAAGTKRPKKKRRQRGGKHGVPGSADDTRRCTAKAVSTGERCKAPAIKGGFVCRVHGGAAKHVQAKAKQRLLELVEPALASLQKVLTDPDSEDSVKVRAALGILDRTGHGPGATVTVQDSRWDAMFSDVVDLDRTLDGPDEHRALPGGVGEEDVEQVLYDAQAEVDNERYDAEAREYEAGRIRPDENTVRGEVVFPPPPTTGPSEYGG